MAEKLQLDTGIMEYEVNGGELLRFNPSDPNLYHRFRMVADELPAMEKELLERGRAQTEPEAAELIELLNELDTRMKQRLSYVFGEENDFDRILGGVNLMAVGRNGERVVTNLLNALKPILELGAKRHRREAAAQAVEEANAARGARGK